MTPEELQDVVDAVIASLKTNGKTIMQLTEVTSITDSDYFEIHGGRRIAYEHLYDSLLSETEDIIDDFETDVNTALDGKLDYYNASWIFDSQQRTEANFNAFVAALNAKKVIYLKNDMSIIKATYNPQQNRIYIWYYSYPAPSFVECYLTLSNGTVTLSPNDVTGLASTTTVTAVANRVTTLEGQVSDLSGLTTDVTSLGNRMTAAENSITSITGSTGALYVGYHNTNDSDYSALYTVSAALDMLIFKTREVYCTMDEYNAMVEAGTLDDDTKYFIYED